MACNITLNGITKGCNDNIGGIKTVYFLPFEYLYPVFPPDMVTGKVVGLSYSSDFKKYEFNKQTAQFTTTPQVNEATDTIVYSTDLVMKFNRLEAAKHQEIYNLCKSDVVAIVVDNNNESWILGGYQSGNVTGGTMTSGINYADGSGYEITVNFLEYERVLNPLYNLDFATFFIGDGVGGIRGFTSMGSSIENQSTKDNGSGGSTSMAIKVIYKDKSYEIVPSGQTSVDPQDGGIIFLFDLVTYGGIKSINFSGQLAGFITIDDYGLFSNCNEFYFDGNMFSTAQKNRIVDEVNRVTSGVNNGILQFDTAPSLNDNSVAFKALSARGWTIIY